MPKLVLAPEVVAALPPEIDASAVVAQARLSVGVTAQFGETHVLRGANGEFVVLTRESSFAPFASVALRTGTAARLEQKGFDTVLLLTTADGAEHALKVDAFAQGDVERVVGGAPAPTSAPASAPTFTSAPTPESTVLPVHAHMADSTSAPTREATPAPTHATAPVPAVATRGGGLLIVIGFAFIFLYSLVQNRTLSIAVMVVGIVLIVRGVSLLRSATTAHADAVAANALHKQAAAQVAERASDVADARDPRGTALRDAIEAGDLEKMRRLLSAGANPRGVDEDGAGMLHCAIDSGLDDDTITGVIQLLLSHGADLNAADASGDTPLMMAATNGFVSTAQLLLDRCASLETKNDEGWTALRSAIEFDDEAVALLLLTRGADASSTDLKGCTILSAAQRQKQQQVLSALLAQGIESIA